MPKKTSTISSLFSSLNCDNKIRRNFTCKDGLVFLLPLSKHPSMYLKPMIDSPQFRSVIFKDNQLKLNKRTRSCIFIVPVRYYVCLESTKMPNADY